jgi:hypothetical protein
MLNLKEIVEHSNKRFNKEIESVRANKNVDLARIERRRNEAYFTRLSRACLGVSQNIALADEHFALFTAIPEMLFSKMFLIGWSKSRKQKEIENAPKLLADYNEEFDSEFHISTVEHVLNQIKDHKYEYTLICHGLSPTSDTILLLADLGRCLRISNAVGIFNLKILLADISWIKYNRSINQLFKAKEFINQLRICLDKRKRLYNALNMEYEVFSISDFENKRRSINKSQILSHITNFRDLARLLWGEQALKGHNQDVQAIIGKSLGQIPNKYLSLLPPTIEKLLSLKNKEVAYALENTLESDLKILRTVSELFSSFDEEIFIYYFAQFFAQSHFSQYLKIAPISETKFDQPFLTHKEVFSEIAKVTVESKGTAPGYIYCPQYKIGSLQLLPYTSISGDVIKNKIDVDEFQSQTILLDDIYDKKLDKIIGVITTTETAHRNRLLSDLLSFIHHLYQFISESEKKEIINHLEGVSAQIAIQISSQTDLPEEYFSIFSEWLKTIGDNVMPFHVIPYLWEDSDWDTEKIENVSRLILKILEIISNICD